MQEIGIKVERTIIAISLSFYYIFLKLLRQNQVSMKDSPYSGQNQVSKKDLRYSGQNRVSKKDSKPQSFL